MILKLQALPQLKGPAIWKDKTPKWALFVHPDAAPSLLELSSMGVRVTDLFRPPDISLSAMAEKRGVQPPGYSGHNYGLCVDVDIEGTLKDTGWTYSELYDKMEEKGWFCHRRDKNKGRSESWHFNYLGDRKDLLALATKHSSTWHLPIEARVKELYGESFKLTPEKAQEELKQLKLYSGEIDGKIGPMSKRAIMQFQKTWGLIATGELDERTQRVLALVGAEKDILPVESP